MDAILQRLSQISDAELRTELKAAGQPCGGIAKTTRKFFEKRLAKHLLATTGCGQDATDNGPKPWDGEKRDKLETTDGMDQQQVNVESKTKDVKKEADVKKSCSSDGLFYVVQLSTEDMDTMDVPDAPTFKVPLCGARVYENRKEAFDMMKKNKGARFKVFKSQQEAETFVNSHQDLSTPKRTEPVSRTGATNVQVVSESANCFQSPKNQQLVGLRKAIEANDQEQYTKIIWNNPRYLISSGDTPTIMKEGPRYNALHVTALGNLASMCRLIIETLEDPQFFALLYSPLQEGPRYNALHVTALGNLASMCRLIIETLEDPQFFALMYPEDSPETRQKRQQVLLDLYLNMPDKGNCETPLHFASKFGNADVVEVLVDNVMCDKTVKNKYGQTAKQIACSRSGDNSTKKRIIHLLEDNYYVPLLRSEDNSTQPVIGELWSPDKAGMQQVNSGIRAREESPVDANICTKAYAGPMSPSEAETFHKHLRTPPSAESKRAAAIRRADSDKGLERVARELARSMHVPWAEYWDFLDAYVDLSSSEGLIQLEEYLQGRQHSQKKVISKTGGDQTNPANDNKPSTPTDDIVSNLMASFENLNIASNSETVSHDIPNRTDTSDVMATSGAMGTSDSKSTSDVMATSDSMEEQEQMTRNANSVPMATDISNFTDRTKSSPLSADEANINNLEASTIPQLGSNLQEQKHDNFENNQSGQLGAIAAADRCDDSETKQVSCPKDDLCDEDEKMDVGNQQEKGGNGDDGRGLMETPKSNVRNHLFGRECDNSEPVYLVGNEPTKLDLDVLRAVSYADNLDDYPCIQQWRQQVEQVPEDRRKRWPTPAKSPCVSATPANSPRNISSTQRLLRYNSPIHTASAARVLLGSPHLLHRSRHLSDPGLARRRVYATSPRGPQQDMPRLILFP
ncbi:ankyrin repeat and LEM domain-containing protein 2-like isoform X2 [Amphiura filiformis]|uniref:ankyrin repeat and LEM domain-containing protein 2-like isoform X2 n=1 Tax=Amphiura filiformis TaxID=82378 RepID=UPI003B21D69B